VAALVSPKFVEHSFCYGGVTIVVESGTEDLTIIEEMMTQLCF